MAAAARPHKEPSLIFPRVYLFMVSIFRSTGLRSSGRSCIAHILSSLNFTRSLRRRWGGGEFGVSVGWLRRHYILKPLADGRWPVRTRINHIADIFTLITGTVGYLAIVPGRYNTGRDRALLISDWSQVRHQACSWNAVSGCT